ncbi:hypothetical protein [Paenibacillus sp. NPDC058174]|uniref:hypothetical protein n=1 Tax=Paenibacillus sp. NPDC058174 TaxID=3346366 RepID=UPI0036D7F8FA
MTHPVAALFEPFDDAALIMNVRHALPKSAIYNFNKKEAASVPTGQVFAAMKKA